MVLLGNNLINAAVALLVGEIARRYLGGSEFALFVATGTAAFAILVFSEITPKVIGAAYPERIALPSSYILTPLLKLLRPVVWFVNLFVQTLLWLLRLKPAEAAESKLTPEELRTLELVKGYTCGSAERIIGVVNAVKYVVANKIPGAIVECGVWRGGSMMAAAAALLGVKDASRDIYLFDTFEGMSEPTEKDVMFDGQKASSLLGSSERKEGIINYWCVAGIEDVTRNVTSTGYPKEKLHFIKGKVEDTIPKHAPDQIALLRLDTDWYESTAHELEHLFPRVAPNGVVIIDDYGHWQGAREAVDEYFARQKFKPLFNRQDYTGRLLVKPAV